jgi:hypothetical protein
MTNKFEMSSAGRKKALMADFLLRSRTRTETMRRIFVILIAVGGNSD